MLTIESALQKSLVLDPSMARISHPGKDAWRPLSNSPEVRVFPLTPGKTNRTPSLVQKWLDIGNVTVVAVSRRHLYAVPLDLPALLTIDFFFIRVASDHTSASKSTTY